MYQGPNPDRSETPNAALHREVTAADLPVSCPMPAMSLWNSHQQVYIPLEKLGDEATCPYCGTRYRLVAAEHGAA